MIKSNEKSIGNINLIGTFIVLLLVAFVVIMLSVNSKIDQFKNLQNAIKLKFLEDKKDDIRFKLKNINILIQNQTGSSIEQKQAFILNFIDQINKNNHYVIQIEVLSEENKFYQELLEKSEHFIYSLHHDEKTDKEIATIQYFVYNSNWNWVISTKFDDDIINDEITTWEKHLNELIRDNIYVHISLLFLFSISLLLVTYMISRLASKTISKCKISIKKREEGLKYKIAQLKIELQEEHTKFLNQTKLIQKQSKMLALGELLSNLSHQWRLPLSEISNTALQIKDKIENKNTIPQEDGEMMTHIQNSALYLSQTIDDFRVFLKADSLKIDFVVNEIIEKAMCLNQAIIDKNKIIIIQDLDEEKTIHNLSFGLLQALVNIVYNAKDVLQKCAIEDRYLFITSKNYDNKIEIIVTDTGGGIPTEIIGNIFQPYFTTKQKTYGTGLGLHMAYNIINQNMSGTISVENKKIAYKSKNFIGASFTITLFLEH